MDYMFIFSLLESLSLTSSIRESVTSLIEKLDSLELYNTLLYVFFLSVINFFPFIS